MEPCIPIQADLLNVCVRAFINSRIGIMPGPGVPGTASTIRKKTLLILKALKDRLLRLRLVRLWDDEDIGEEAALLYAWVTGTTAY
jgi:hypothetical protein